MSVLRCHYYGEKVNVGDNFCSHCDNGFDKPHVDDVDTAFQDIGNIMLKIVGFNICGLL